MNIFILSWDHQTNARWHCDKHVVKMPLETTQMLSTVYHRYTNDGPYKPVHQKHPCTLWAGTTIDNYKWLHQLGVCLCKEYTYRYDRVHACEKVLAMIAEPPVKLKEEGFTTPYQAMPDVYKDRNTLVAYHNYYINEKARFCKWKRRPIPKFMQTVMVQMLSHSRQNRPQS